MKHSKSTKAIALLMSMTMITSVFVGNTLSRYVTSVSSTDSARVAVWGINGGTTTMNLFKEDYIKDTKTIVASNVNGERIMAPGTEGEAPFSIIKFDQDVAPEVAYEVKISFDDSAIADEIKNNPSVQWKLDNGVWGTLEQLKTSILSLSGDASGVKIYEPGQFATAFEDNTPHTIAWQWLLDNDETVDVEVCDDGGNNCQTVTKTSNEYDTYMGNLALDGNLEAVITVGITATQVDDLVSVGMLDGMNQVVNIDDIQPAVFRSMAPRADLQEVKIDGEAVDPDNYTVTEGSTIITFKKSFLKTLEKGKYILEIVSKGMTAKTQFSVEEAPIVHKNIIPEGGVYYKGVTSTNVGSYDGATEVLTAGDEFPEIVNNGDVYVYGDYEYRYNMAVLGSWVQFSGNGWGVKVLDTTKSEYSELLTTINGKDLKYLYFTFIGCDKLINSPKIPETVIEMEDTFSGCTSLVNAPILPSGLTSIFDLFYNCTSLTGTIEINFNPKYYDYAFGSTVKPIVLTGSSTMLDKIAATGNNGNVTVGE